MTKTKELRDLIRFDAQACEELTIGDGDLDLDELKIRAESLLANIRLYEAVEKQQ